jgi:hypothetical protein
VRAVWHCVWRCTWRRPGAHNWASPLPRPAKTRYQRREPPARCRVAVSVFLRAFGRVSGPPGSARSLLGFDPPGTISTLVVIGGPVPVELPLFVSGIVASPSTYIQLQSMGFQLPIDQQIIYCATNIQTDMLRHSIAY